MIQVMLELHVIEERPLADAAGGRGPLLVGSRVLGRVVEVEHLRGLEIFPALEANLPVVHGFLVEHEGRGLGEPGADAVAAIVALVREEGEVRIHQVGIPPPLSLDQRLVPVLRDPIVGPLQGPAVPLVVFQW